MRTMVTTVLDFGVGLRGRHVVVSLPLVECLLDGKKSIVDDRARADGRRAP